jgi:ABC-type polysaccharide/polyol phosphate export permease
VFFRDLGNVLRHLLRLWFYLSPALYSMSTLDASSTFQNNPVLRTLAHANPFAILFESYRAVIYGKPDGSPHAPDLQSLVLLLVASILLVALGAIVFKRLEPTYAKVL